MRILWLAMLAALVAGCAGTLPSRTEAEEVAELLDRYHRLAGAPVEDQRKAVAAAQAAFDQTGGEFQRLHLGLLLSLPHASGREEARIVALLAPLDTAPGAQASPRRGLAALLARSARLALDRQRVAREEHRHLETGLRDEQRRNQELQQKLEALRSIDRDLRRRPAGR